MIAGGNRSVNPTEFNEAIRTIINQYAPKAEPKKPEDVTKEQASKTEAPPASNTNKQAEAVAADKTTAAEQSTVNGSATDQPAAAAEPASSESKQPAAAEAEAAPKEDGGKETPTEKRDKI